VGPYYLRSPKSAGLLLGYAALSQQQIAVGIRLLGEAVDRVRNKRDSARGRAQ
jgi:DNA-binding transcriptional MocR family regulator